jgi:hypothetical protein
VTTARMRPSARKRAAVSSLMAHSIYQGGQKMPSCHDKKQQEHLPPRAQRPQRKAFVVLLRPLRTSAHLCVQSSCSLIGRGAGRGAPILASSWSRHTSRSNSSPATTQQPQQEHLPQRIAEDRRGLQHHAVAVPL